jgi:DNA repair protein RecO (recombination protein O)
MPAVRSPALVLRSVEVFETSQILTLFTRELGKVSALAKGARRLRSPFQSALDLLSVCDIVVLHKASEALDLLTEAALIERFDSLRHDLSALYAGYYISELLGELTHHHAPHPRLFDAAVVTLRHLDDPLLRLRRLLRFELACLQELGLMPALQRCVGCGEVVEAEEAPVAFGLATGGVLCKVCRVGQAHVALLPGPSLNALRVLSAPGPAWRTLQLEPEAWRGLRQALGLVMSHHLGHRPRMLDFLAAGPIAG